MKNKKTKIELHREVIVMPDGEHKDFLKLVKHEKKSKSKVAREAIQDKINKTNY